MRCFVCGKSTLFGPLFRQNPKGSIGVWACSEHDEIYHSVESEKEFVELVETIHEGSKE